MGLVSRLTRGFLSSADGRLGNQPRWRERVRVELAAVLDHSAQCTALVACDGEAESGRGARIERRSGDGR